MQSININNTNLYSETLAVDSAQRHGKRMRDQKMHAQPHGSAQGETTANLLQGAGGVKKDKI